MTTRPFHRAALGALLLAAAAIAQAQQSTTAPATPRALPTETKAWKGDFDGMVKRRNIYKYYAADKLTLDIRQEQKKAREQVAPGKT